MFFSRNDRRALHPGAGLEAYQKIFRHDVLSRSVRATAHELAAIQLPWTAEYKRGSCVADFDHFGR
jgi:hypothetical protein